MTAHVFMKPEDLACAIAYPRITVRRVAAEVCESLGHSFTAVMGPSRKADDCRVRELVCYIAYREGLSYPQIGRVLKRDHTTIMHAVRNEAARRGEA